MGDMFHNSSANQSSTNQQVGISTRDIGGSQTVGGAGSITAGSGVAVGSGANVQVSTLDPAALNAAAYIAHDATTQAAATSQAAMEGYQRALSVAGETAAQALQLASSGAGSGAQIAPTGFNPSTMIWVAIGGLALVLVIGKLRK